MGSDRHALTGNAADAAQVKFAKRHNERREVRERDDMRAALEHPPTRRLLMRILRETRCDVAHVFEKNPEFTASVWDPSAKIHYHSGRRDVGLLIQGWINAADPSAIVAMLTDELARVQQLDREVQAAKVSPTTQGA